MARVDTLHTGRHAGSANNSNPLDPSALTPDPAAARWPGDDDTQSLWEPGHVGELNGSQKSSTKPLSRETGSQQGYTARENVTDSLSIMGETLCDISFSEFPVSGHQTSVNFSQTTDNQLPLGLQHSESPAMATGVQDMLLWEDFNYVTPFFQGPYADLGLFLSPTQIQTEEMDLVGLEDDSDYCPSDAPLPTFLGARSSPDPQEGQDLRFDGFVSKNFSNRRYRQARVAERQSHQMSRSSRRSGARTEKADCPLEAFPPELSRDGDQSWESENLGHVPSLLQTTYDEIVDKFQILNVTNAQHTQFVTGDFPSRAACNAFIQLYFEEFNHIFPFLHQPTFDPATEHWLLVLAVIATGCRFSRVVAAGACADLMQELLRRAFYSTVSRKSSLL